MEISDVKRRVVETIERTRSQAAERRARTDAAARDYAAFLDQIAIPIFKQVANVLRSEGYPFTVFTPGGSVRLMSDRATEDYVELVLETGDGQPVVTAHTSRSRGRRSIASEHEMGAPAALTEDDVLVFVLKAVEPLVER